MISTLVAEPKIDCHLHVFAPARFAYNPAAHYFPIPPETGSPEDFLHVMDAYGVRAAFLVGPNSGYVTDNSCLLDALTARPDCWRGAAVTSTNISLPDLAALKQAGVVAVTANVGLLGYDSLVGIDDLVEKLHALDMMLTLQVAGDQLLTVLPHLESAPSDFRVVVDHCGLPIPSHGVGQPGFAALLTAGRTRPWYVKLSGLYKISERTFPNEDCFPFVDALLDAFTPDRCLWGSDWPYLRAKSRIDYGTLLLQAGLMLPNPEVRRKVFWETPRRLLGFGDEWPAAST